MWLDAPFVFFDLGRIVRPTESIRFAKKTESGTLYTRIKQEQTVLASNGVSTRIRFSHFPCQWPFGAVAKTANLPAR
jgi:hypothetical protein